MQLSFCPEKDCHLTTIGQIKEDSFSAEKKPRACTEWAPQQQCSDLVAKRVADGPRVSRLRPVEFAKQGDM